MNSKITRRVAAAAGLTGAAVMALTSVGAGGAEAGPLPGANVTKKLVDGTSVNIQLFDENVNIQRAVSNVPTSREVWLSGKVRVTVGGGAEGGSINAGYIVGCQLNFGASGGTKGGLAVTPQEGGGAPTASSSGDANLGFNLGPGQAGYVPVIQTKSGDDTINSFTFTGNRGGVVYSQERFTVNGCAGFAEAKAKIQVTVDTDSVKGVVTAYGKPFSIG